MKNTSFFLFLNLIGLCLSLNLHGQSFDNQSLLENYDTELLEVYLDKADIQQNQEEWFRLAEYGIEVVVAKWEQEVLLISGENLDLFSLKQDLESNLNQIVEERLTQYLADQFFRNLDGPEIGNLLSVIDEQNLEFLYQVDGDGNIITDSEGSPLYKESTGLFDITNQDEHGNIIVLQEGDKSKWSTTINGSIESILSNWESMTFAAYSEFLINLDSEIRTEFERNYEITFEQQKSSLRRELDHLYLKEQNRLVLYRLYDKNSLEYKTQQETAAMVSQKLITETQLKLNEGIDSLMAGLDEQVGMVQTGGGVIDGDQWQESFRLLMEQGLTDWDSAEETLLMERIEWEQEIGSQMQEGEEAWAEAFQQLQEKRKDWFDKYRETLEEGNLLWADQSRELEIAIGEAIVELEANVENRKTSMQNRVDNLIGMLLQSVNMMRTARSSWVYWMDKGDNEELGTFDQSEIGYDVWSMRKSIVKEQFSNWEEESVLHTPENQILIDIMNHKDFINYSLDWFEENIQPENFTDENIGTEAFNQIYSSFTSETDIFAIKETRTAFDSFFSWYRRETEISIGNSNSFQEAIYWTEEIFRPYTAHSSETQNKLASTYGIVVFNDPDSASAFTTDGELKEALLSTDLLYEDDLWESLYLDDFQVELLKSRAYEQYWFKEVEIAREVLEYAEDNSSGKETADETLSALNSAENEYNNSLDEYQQLVAQLQSIGDGLQGQQDNIRGIQEGISAKQEELSRYRTQYQDLINQFLIQNPDYLKDKYQGFYKELLAAKGLDPDRVDDSVGSAMEDYLAAAHKYNLENQVSLVSSHLEVLINGTEGSIGTDKRLDPSYYSLGELKNLVDDIHDFELDFLHGEDSYAESDFFTSLTEELHLSMNDFFYMEFTRLWSDLLDHENKQDNRTAYQMLYLVEQITQRAEGWLENRMAEIRLLGSGDFGTWFHDYYDGDDSAGLATDGEKLDYALEMAGYSEKELIGLRIDTEYLFFQDILSSYDNWDGTGVFGFYNWTGDGEEMPTCLEDISDEMFKQIQWESLESQFGNSLDTDSDIIRKELANKVAALDALNRWWSDLENSLEDNGDTIIKALRDSDFLTPVDFISLEGDKGQYNYLSCYLEGGGLLVTQQGDMGKKLISKNLGEIERNIDLSNILIKHQYTAISLKNAVMEKGWEELSIFLEEEGLIDGSLTFLSPDQVWDQQGFYDVGQVYAWIDELNNKANTIYSKIPDYVALQLRDFIEEIQDFTAVNLVYSFSGELPDSTDLIQAELENKIERNGEILSAINMIQRTNRSELNKLLILERTVSGSEELHPFIVDQLIETAALDLASISLLEGQVPGEVWADYLDSQSVVMNVDGSYEIDTWKIDIMEKASNYLTIAIAIENPEEQDWDSAGSGLIEYVQTAYWNTMDIETALQLAKQNFISVPAYYEMVQLWDAYGLSSGIEGETIVTENIFDGYILEGFYNNDTGKAMLDEKLQNGYESNWTGDSFSFYSNVLTSFIGDDLRNSVKDINVEGMVQTASLLKSLSPSNDTEDQEILLEFLTGLGFYYSIDSPSEEQAYFNSFITRFREGESMESMLSGFVPENALLVDREFSGEYKLLNIVSYMLSVDAHFGKDSYTDNFSYSELQNLLLGKLDLSDSEMDFVSSVVSSTNNNREILLSDWMDYKVDSLILGNLTGEDFYWTGMWNVKRGMESSADWELSSFRSVEIFNGRNIMVVDTSLEIGKLWRNNIIGSEVTWKQFNEGLASGIFSVQAGVNQVLLDLANDHAPGSAIFRKALNYGALEAMIETAGLDKNYALSAMNWFSSLSDTVISSIDIDSWLAKETDKRVLLLMDDDELIHFYKKRILHDRAQRGEWEHQSPDVVLELDSFMERVDFSKTYSGKLHGDLTEYIKGEFTGNLSKQLEILNQGKSAQGTLQWDDPFFTATTVGSEAHDTLNLITNLKTCNKEDITYNEDGSTVSTSINVTGKNRSIYTFALNLLSGELNSINETLGELNYRKTILDRAIQIKTDYAGDIKNFHWRSFLTDDYLFSANNHEKEGPGEGILVEKIADDRESRDLTINTSGDNQPMFNTTDDMQALNRTDNDLDNWYLDGQNDYFDSATLLTGSLEVWLSGEMQSPELLEKYEWLSRDFDSEVIIDGDVTENIWVWLEDKDRDDIRDFIVYQNTQEGDYFEKRQKADSIKKSVDYYKEEMTRFSNLVYILETVGTDSVLQLEQLKPIRDEIESLEGEIAGAQANWQRAIDNIGDEISTMGYNQLSGLYEDIYLQTKEAMKNIEESKHNYSIARAIYDYATAGYLTASNMDSPTDESGVIPEEDNDSVGDEDETADGEDVDPEEAGEPVRQDLLDLINRVTPLERLTYVLEKHTRAKAAYDALYLIINDNKEENYNVYENNQAYAGYFDDYLVTYRESLTLSKMNSVLNAAIARQESITRRSHSKWQKARSESFRNTAVYNEDKELTLVDTENLEDLELVKDSGGNWSVGWNSGSSDVISDEINNEYFGVDDKDEYGMSQYENDLNDWLRELETISRNKGQGKLDSMMERWSLALQWEDYSKLSDKNAYFDGMNKNQTNQTTDEMKEDARRKVEAAWSSAYYSIGDNGIEDENRLYNFFKLVQKSGGVSIGITLPNGESPTYDFEDLQIDLDKEENFSEINTQLMSGIKEHRIAAGVLFGYAAVNFTIAAVLGAIFFLAWGAAAFVALGLLYTGLAVDQVYKAKIREDGIDDNIKKEINISRDHRKEMEEAIAGDLLGIEDLRAEFEAEQELLDALKGKSSQGEIVGREEQRNNLKDGIEKAFELNHQDLEGLLDKSGRIENGDYDAALNDLLLDYQSDLSDEVLATYRNNNESLSGLENAASRRKNLKERDMAAFLNAEDGAADKQRIAVESYQRELKNYIFDDSADLSDLRIAASVAFTKPAFSIREHLLRLFEEQKELTGDILADDQFPMDIAEDLLESQKTMLTGDGQYGVKGIFDYRYDAYMDLRLYESDMMRLDQKERRDHWENQMQAILARGQMEWIDGEKRLKGKYEDWTENVEREYRNKKDGWGDKYLDFLEDKNEWLNVVTEQSTRFGDMDVLENFGEVTQAAIGNAGQDIIITTLAEPTPDPNRIIGEVIDVDLLDALLDNAINLTRGIKFFEPTIFTSLDSDKFTTSDLLKNIKDFQMLQNEEYKQHVSKMEYQRMLDKLTEAEKNLDLQVGGANNNMSSSLHKTMRNDGYVLSGNSYKRDLVVGSTVIDGMLYEQGFVDVYDDFTNYTSDFTSELTRSDDEINNMNAEALDSLLENAMKKITEEVEEIFGDNEDDTTILLEEMGLVANSNYDEDEEKRRNEEEDYEEDDDENNAAYKFIQKIRTEDGTEQRGVEASPGKFGKHIGYAPKFMEEPDYEEDWRSNVQFKGQGEMGTIMGQFIFNKMREGLGYNMVNRPSYEQKLWDDRGDWLEAPSFRALSDMVISIVSIPLGGAPALAMNLVSSAAFTTADVANGVMTAEQGLLSFVKSASISIGTKFIPGINIGDGLLANMTDGVLNQVINNAVAGTINGFNIDEDGKFGWDGDVLKESLIGKGALAGYAMGAAQTASNALLNTAATGFFGDSASDYAGFTNFASQMVAQGMNYAITGEATFNLLMVSDIFGSFAKEPQHSGDTYWDGVKESFNNGPTDAGMFELHLTKDGSYGKFGTGGAAIGIKGALSALSGLDEAVANIQIALDDDRKNAIALRALYSNGSDMGRERFKRIMNDKTILNMVGEVEGVNEDGQTIATSDGKEIINIYGDYGVDLSDQLNLGVLLEHESFRDGVYTDDNNRETIQAVFAHTVMAERLAEWFGDKYSMDDQIAKDVSALNMAREAKDMGMFAYYADETYDSSQDFWKQIEVGERIMIEANGKKDYVDPQGNILISHNPALLGKIKELEKLKSLGLSVDGHLSELKAEYNESNTIDPDDSQQIKDLTALLLGQPVGTTGFARNINNNFEEMLKEQGYTRLGINNWEFMNGDEVGIENGTQMDITDMFFKFGALDQRSILGNKSIISNELFDSLHISVVDRAMVNGIREPSTFPSASIRNDSDFFTALQLSAKRGAKSSLLTGENSAYDSRLSSYINSRSDIAERAYEYLTSFDEMNYDQKAMSKELGWGYLEQENATDEPPIPEGYTKPISSLCYAMSLMASHDANNMISTSWERKYDFYEKALDKKWIQPNGRVTDTVEFAELYSGYTSSSISPYTASEFEDYGNIYNIYESNRLHKVLFNYDNMYVQPYEGLNMENHNSYDFYVGVDYSQLYLYNTRY